MKNINLIIISFFIYFYSYSKILIWDFGGVLCGANKIGVARSIGLKHFVFYIILEQKGPNYFQNFVFDFLHKVMPMDKDKKYINAVTPEGITLPLIMCHWQAGTIGSFEIINIINKKINEYEKLGYFKSKREKLLLQKTITAMFDPKVLSNNIFLFKDGITLLKECAESKNFDGSKRNINIGFSNWDPLSFNLFYKKNQQAFQYFDHIEISGNIKLIKPDRKAYNFILEKYNLNPRNCILIDDQITNILGAKKAGMQGIVCEDNDYGKLRNELRFLGAL